MSSPQIQAKPPVSPILPVDLDVMKEISQPTFSAMKAFNGALQKNCSNYQHEVMQFVTRRMHENASMPARLMACKSPLELQGAWAEYWARAFNQYSNEIQRLAHLCEVTSTTDGSANPGQDLAADEYEPRTQTTH